MVILSLLALLFLSGSIHWELDGVLETNKAYVFDGVKCISTMLCDHTNAINGSLSDGRVFRIGIGADFRANLRVSWAEEFGTKILYHIVEDEEKELLFLLGSVLLNAWDDINQELLN